MSVSACVHVCVHVMACETKLYQPLAGFCRADEFNKTLDKPDH